MASGRGATLVRWLRSIEGFLDDDDVRIDLFAALVVKRRFTFSYGHALVTAAIHLAFSAGAQWAVNRVIEVIVG